MRRPPALPFLFFASGALALVYEVLWQRHFALVLGGGAAAATAVLAAYFAGLGVGSHLLGRAAARITRPLRVYAVLEALVAAGALLSFPLSAAVAGRSLVAASASTDHAAPRIASEVLVALVALALPTCAMGGTLPVLARLSEGGGRHLGAGVGLLYAVNTAGAALGALAVPFVLLPALGAKEGLGLTVAANLVVAAFAWTMDRPSSDEPASPDAARPDRAATMPWAHPAVVLAAASGLAAFVLQVSWNRAFAQVHENSTYSFALVVALFVCALALGAQVSRMALGRGRAPEAVIGWAWLLAALLAAIGPVSFVRLTHGLAYLSSDHGWRHDAPRLAGIGSVVVLPAVTALGMAFPALLESAGALRSAAVAIVGRLLAANVAGCVLGALLGGFVLPRAVGLWRGMLMAAAILAAGGAWCLMRARARGRGVAVALVGVVVAVAWRADPPRVRLAEAGDERLVSLAEGADGITAVVERPGSRRLKLNNHYVLGGTGSAGDERMQAHLPLVLHPSPRRLAFLGLGTGITAGGALFHPFDHVTAVELVPEVAAAARRHLREANGGVLDDPRTRLVVADARAYLRSTADRFDVIVGDLAVPWRPGESALYTIESFRAARRALAPGGVFCQWVPLFQLSETELRIVLRTFLTVFPRAQLWRGDFSAEEPALALVARAEPMALDPAVVEAALRVARPDPANLHLASPEGVWLYFAGVLEAADLGSGEERVNRDDRPWLELLGPWNADGAPTRLTGRRLQAWVAGVRRASASRIVALGPRERSAMEAGDWLFELSLALAERDGAAAQSAQEHVRALLPEAPFRALFP